MRITVISMLMLFSLAAFAAPQNTCNTNKLVAFNYQTTTSIKDDMLVLSGKDAERSGCCSHHGGVCGCTNGRAQCCDGTLSPSCGCD